MAADRIRRNAQAFFPNQCEVEVGDMFDRAQRRRRLMMDPVQLAIIGQMK